MLSNANILLRALEPSDIDYLYNWENDPAIWKVSNTLTPYSRHVLEQYILNAQADIYAAKQLRLVICKKDSNEPIGCIDLFDFDAQHQRAGIGILIAEAKNRSNGYASMALTLLINYAFKTLHLQQLYCNITVDNTASLHLFSKHKFESVGIKKNWIKNGNEWKDECLMQLINS